ncbi:MAG: glutamate formiminotransferase [Solirubrobacterales bacterium]|nr:glutamate formiminotransferase [Solirubrobacterales bacterium]
MNLLAVPNLSEGRDFAALERLQTALGNEVILLDRHTDVDHHRAVFTISGPTFDLIAALAGLAAAAVREINMGEWQGIHPAIGSMDVCPIVWTDGADRDKAEETALTVAERISTFGVPVFLYGDLAVSDERRERSYFRDGGLDSIWQRMTSGELKPDFGPAQPHPTAGAWLVTARPPLAAFNIELDTNDVKIAKEVAAAVRESGGGLPGVRAIGLLLSTGRVQVSMNIHDPVNLPLARVAEAVRDQAALRGAVPIEAELIGLIPEAALEDYPADLPIRDFDPAFHVIERRVSGER